MTTKFEFVAKTGYTLDDIDLYDGLTYALLVSDLSATETIETIYRVDTELTGIVYMIAKPVATPFPKYLGYINLDAPKNNGYSDVFHTYGEALAAIEQGGSTEDINDLSERSRAYGPKRVKTPNLEVEQFDPLTIQRASDREGSVHPTFGSFGWTVVSPNRTKYNTPSKGRNE